MKYFLSALIMASLYSCRHHTVSEQNTIVQDTIKTFTLPEIPPMLITPETRANFLVNHYWDHVNFGDTNYIHHPELTEQAWADYCDILNHVPLTTAQEAIKKTIQATEQERKVFDYITGLADKYLYDPNSPMRNEEFYIPVLEVMVASPLLNETEKIRPQGKLALANKNRLHTKAYNFTYTTASGAKGTLYQVKSKYTLLFINNPGCHACAENIEAIKSSPVINQLIKQRQLTVLALYPDEELDEWKKHRNEFPSEWINGYDKDLTLKMENLYDLKAIPTLYLLNKEKIVLLKDTTVPAIEEYLLQDNPI